MRAKVLAVAALAGALVLTAGCVRGNRDYSLGRKAELLQDYDTALVHYQRALRADPGNAEYKLKVDRMRFEAGQYHVEQGQRLMAMGDLTDVERALGEFQRAMDIDPSSAIAEQMARQAVAKIAELKGGAKPSFAKPNPLSDLETMPPELRPLSADRINLRMGPQDARIVYETIAKLAGLSVLFDPDFSPRRISVELPNVTLQQALDAVALESKSFWKPVTPGIIFVAPDNPQKRMEYEDQIVKTFYLANTLTPQDLTEAVGTLRTLLQLRQVQQINSQNAIVIRDTPDKVAVAGKILSDIDKQRAEVMLQVSVLEVNMNRERDLGIQPGTSATLTFNPRSAIQPGTSSSSSSSGSSGSSSSTPQVTLNNLRHLSSADYSLTLPGAAVQALLTDSTTKIIQNPEMMITDGDTAHLKIGDRVPIATGSFQAGLGTTTVGAVSPLVNTQFQYQDVGVNIDVTPRVHPNEEVTLKLKVEVSSVTSFQNIGGIQQPVISQRSADDEVTLRNGEVSVLSGLVQHTTTKSETGWPGFAKIPFLRYFFSGTTNKEQDDEVLIVLTPHVVRMPQYTAENLQSLFTGTAQDIQILPKTAPAPSAAAPAAPEKGTGQAPAPAQPAPAGALKFNPATATLQPGQTTTIALEVADASDLYSIPMILHYDPKVISVVDVRDGGFLSGGTQVVSIFHRIDPTKGDVILNAMRPPKTAGVSGSGTLIGIVVKALAPGTSPLEIEQVSARNSQQKAVNFTTQSASISVGPKP